ncbi:hypothetical protein LZA78_02295 [Sinirhodobacter sp. WL0062]|uniref:Lipoprotein n=1 Tax=Rhodobacter flavimaris TaxID=2907145 RepID=A0ABS8YR06_9RHOB|nr:hypothetical protein [Sinirhodobacter sp. WL0062]MCE5972322.1 hypothetical protein [Sinirhodobacter sp. WL0062]
MPLKRVVLFASLIVGMTACVAEDTPRHEPQPPTFSIPTAKPPETTKECIRAAFYALPRTNPDEIPIDFRDMPGGWKSIVVQYTNNSGDIFTILLDRRDETSWSQITHENKVLSLYGQDILLITNDFFPLAPSRTVPLIPLIKACA